MKKLNSISALLLQERKSHVCELPICFEKALYASRNTLYFMLFTFNFLPLLVYATSTMYCKWHATYFDVLFIDNYGGDNRAERFANDVASRTNIIIRIDSFLKNLRRQGKLEHFKRWKLVDDYTKSYDYVGAKRIPGPFRVTGREVWLCLTDSISINKALKKLWQISDIVIRPSKMEGMWLFSLHVGLSKTRLGARPFRHGGSSHERPDSNLLWLQCEGGFDVAHHWHQHETDDYYHQYTGLYLTRQNVIEAQKLLLEHCNLKSTIVSHHITSAIIKKYAH